MMSRILNHEQNTAKYAHLTKQGEARKSGRKLPWDDPAWQKRIREAKQAVADAAARQLRFDDDAE
jgi:hypothetical protein